MSFIKETNISSVSEFDYNGLGYLCQGRQEILSSENVLTTDYTRDPLGRAVEIGYPDESQAGTLLEVDYTSLGQVSSITRDPDGSPEVLAGYDYAGTHVLQLDYDNTSTKVIKTITYDDFGRVSTHQSFKDVNDDGDYDSPGDTNIAEFVYTYDSNGNILTQTFGHRDSQNPPDNVYTYDSLDRLTSADYLDSSSDEDFDYDLLGNRIQVTNRDDSVDTYSHNNVNEYNQMVMDINGSNVTKIPLYDDAGNLSQDHQGYQYFYDYENRLTEIQDDEDNPVAKYEYDALGRRIEKIEYASPSHITTRYYYDGWRVLAETNENDLVQREYVYGNYLDEVLVMTDSSDDHYYAHDHLFSPVALIDEDGDILERYEYDAYGKCTFLDSGFNPLGTQASGHGNTRLFTGQVLDILDDGDYLIMYYKNRYYDPETGRFIQQDPIGVRDGTALVYFAGDGIVIFKMQSISGQYADGMCLFEYLKSLPLNATDSLGLQYQPIFPGVPGYHLAQKPPQKPKCGVCGPDITKYLMRASCHLEHWFSQLDEPDRESFCAGKDNLSYGAIKEGWDIDELHDNYMALIPAAKGCGTRDCFWTVMVHGKCYNTGSVNYFIYGLMRRICDEGVGGAAFKQRVYSGLSRATAAIGAPNIPNDPTGCKTAWMKGGYNRNPEGVTCGIKSWCKKCGSPYSGSPFRVLWRNEDGHIEEIQEPHKK